MTATFHVGDAIEVWYCRLHRAAETGEEGMRCGLDSQRTLGHERDDWVSNWRPGLVLDPFGGSGTTALVATGHGRDCILIDLDERNFELALQRVGPFILEKAAL